jgi:hypothetical protein
MNYYLIVYDIPARLTKEIVNPSEQFKRHGVRINYSCWIVPEGRVALLPINEMTSKGAKVEIVRFDSNEKDSLMRMAKIAMMEEAGRIRRALDHTVSVAKSRLSAVKKSWNDLDFKKAGAYASVHMKRVQDAIKSADECALAFDLTGDMGEVLKGMREMYAAEQAAISDEYNRIAKKKGVQS